MTTPEKLADVFVEVADTLVDDFDLVDFLHNLADHAADVSGAPAVGLMLGARNGSLHYMAASSQDAEHLELFQLQHDEGPCLDCFRTGKPVIIADMRDAERRWPDFGPRAISTGVRGVHAFPMRLRERTIGALNVFAAEPLPLEPSDARVIQAMADVATIAILQERAISSAEVLTEQLQGALNSRIVIEQAKGVLSRDHDMTVDAAFQILRSYARSNQLRLGDVAHDIVNRTITIPVHT